MAEGQRFNPRHAARWLLLWVAERLTPNERRFLLEVLLTPGETPCVAASRVRATWQREGM